MAFFESLLPYYLWFKAFHLIAVVCWFAALFYLPRLFVYHAATDDAPGKERFKVMERKLYKGIANPSMMVAVTLGLILIAINPAIMSQGWIHAKITLVVLLVVYHILCKIHLKAFAEDRNSKSHVYFRWFNEAPVLVLVAVIILAVVKPF